MFNIFKKQIYHSFFCIRVRFPLQKICAGLLAVAACLAGVPSTALSHGVYIFAWPEGDKICTESYFSRSSKVRNGEVLMLDSTGTILHSGQSDVAGNLCFPAPESARELRLIVKAGQGHRADFLLPEADVERAVKSAHAVRVNANPLTADNSADTGINVPVGVPAGSVTVSPSTTASPPGESSACSITCAIAFRSVVQRVLREEIQKELSPLQSALSEMQREQRRKDAPGWRDITAGLGWIAGLAGLAAFYAVRIRKG